MSDLGESLLLAFVLGVAASVAASLVWLWTLRRLHPRIAISPVIAEDPSGDEPSWHIKIINRSSRAAVDVRFELVRLRHTSARNGAVLMRRSVACGAAPLILPGRRRNDLDHNNCYRIRVFENPRELLSAEGNTVRLRVFGRDEVSGIGSVVERVFTYAPSDIKVGRFARGQSFDVD